MTRISSLLLLVVVLVSVVCCASAGCGPVQEGVKIYGKPLKTYYTVKNWQGCMKKCNDNNLCYDWNFVVSRFGGGCSLYNGYSSKTENYQCQCSTYAGSCS